MLVVGGSPFMANGLIEVDGRGDEVYMLFQVLGNMICIATNMGLAMTIFEQMVFGVEKMLNLGSCCVEREPVPARR
jgi:hypothetical protein